MILCQDIVDMIHLIFSSKIYRCLITSFFLNFSVISKDELINNNGRSKNGSFNKNRSTADVAFRSFDENRDGYITKQELQKSSKMTKTQVII